MSGTYIMLIGKATRSKHKYVRWEAEFAIEKKCRVIGVNLDYSRRVDVERAYQSSATLVPFSSRIHPRSSRMRLNISKWARPARTITTLKPSMRSLVYKGLTPRSTDYLERWA